MYPLNGTLNVGGPDVFLLDDLGRITLDACPDGRSAVIAGPAGTASVSAAVSGDVLTTKGDACIARTHCTDWLS
ncbi:hypothetical protein ACFYY1_38660 [Streptomyces sp. NPDC001890]|uniref:hypothetical protein n=1 Tax=Streptomyces sp. NPDC001890 TaxID=3364620 RepID=UPI00369DC999